jgi:hypothetical protein
MTAGSGLYISRRKMDRPHVIKKENNTEHNRQYTASMAGF